MQALSIIFGLFTFKGDACTRLLRILVKLLNVGEAVSIPPPHPPSDTQMLVSSLLFLISTSGYVVTTYGLLWVYFAPKAPRPPSTGRWYGRDD